MRSGAVRAVMYMPLEWTILYYDGIEWSRIETDLFPDIKMI